MNNNDEIPSDGHLIIIGAMRSGTTTLYRHLKQHPAICAPLVKEPRFFTSLPDTKVTNYSDLWSFDSSIHRYALEASVDYTKYPAEIDVPKKIHLYGLSPKFIYIVRNPFTRIESHYAFMKNRLKEWERPLDEGILLDQSDYYLQLKQFIDVFPQENFLIVDFDEFTSNPKESMQRILAFLELPEDPKSEYSEVNNAALNVSPLEKRALRFSKAFKLLPRPVKSICRKILIKIKPPVKKRKLTATERKKIANHLRPNMKKLQQEFNINVNKWGF